LTEVRGQQSANNKTEVFFSIHFNRIVSYIRLYDAYVILLRIYRRVFHGKLIVFAVNRLC